MKILTLNARNWNRDRDPQSPFYWRKRMAAMGRMIREIDPDIICFQEMLYPATLYIPSEYRKVGFSISHSIYVKKGLRTRKHRFRIHTEKAEVFYKDTWWLVINVHSTWKHKTHVKVMSRISKWINEARVWYSNCIACGDFNNPPMHLEELIRIEPSSLKAHTFKRFDSEEVDEIDYFLSGAPAGDESVYVLHDGYGAERISDHYPVLLCITTI